MRIEIGIGIGFGIGIGVRIGVDCCWRESCSNTDSTTPKL